MNASRRRWFQFRLSTLFLLMTVCALAVLAVQERQQRLALAQQLEKVKAVATRRAEWRKKQHQLELQAAVRLHQK